MLENKQTKTVKKEKDIKNVKKKKTIVREYAEAIIVAVVLAMIIRSFVVQAFKIPSGSMMDTLLIGDFLLVNKFIYRFTEPKRGDVIVFKYPGNGDRDPNYEHPGRKEDAKRYYRLLKITPLFWDKYKPFPMEKLFGTLIISFIIILGTVYLAISYRKHIDYIILFGVISLAIVLYAGFKGKIIYYTPRDFIKRCIAVEGDKIEIRNKVVYINDRPIVETYKRISGMPPISRAYGDIFWGKDFLGSRDNFGPVIVPKGYLFMMGDNRDNSSDSRYWGFLDKKLIKGQAFILYWSWNSETHLPRLSRIGNLIR